MKLSKGIKIFCNILILTLFVGGVVAFVYIYKASNNFTSNVNSFGISLKDNFNSSLDSYYISNTSGHILKKETYNGKILNVKTDEVFSIHVIANEVNDFNFTYKDEKLSWKNTPKKDENLDSYFDLILNEDKTFSFSVKNNFKEIINSIYSDIVLPVDFDYSLNYFRLVVSNDSTSLNYDFSISVDTTGINLDCEEIVW